MEKGIIKKFDSRQSVVINKYDTNDKVLNSLVRNKFLDRIQRGKSYYYSSEELEKLVKEKPLVFFTVSRGVRDLSGKIARVLCEYDAFYEMSDKDGNSMLLKIEEQVRKYLNDKGIEA